jgi:hypothetical protein
VYHAWQECHTPNEVPDEYLQAEKAFEPNYFQLRQVRCSDTPIRLAETVWLGAAVLAACCVDDGVLRLRLRLRASVRLCSLLYGRTCAHVLTYVHDLCLHVHAQVYEGMAYFLDVHMGIIVDALKAKGMWDQTLGGGSHASPTRTLRSLTHSHASLTHPLTRSLTASLAHSRTHAPTYSLTHSPTRLTHSLNSLHHTLTRVLLKQTFSLLSTCRAFLALTHRLTTICSPIILAHILVVFVSCVLLQWCSAATTVGARTPLLVATTFHSEE